MCKALREAAQGPWCKGCAAAGSEARVLCRLTRLAADTGAGPWKNQTVLFLGAEDGRVLKVLMATQQHPTGTPAPSDNREPGVNGDTGSEALLLEEISLYDPRR